MAPYLQAVLQPRLEGVAAIDGALAWTAEPQALSVDVARLALDGVRVVDGTARPGRDGAPRDPLSWKALEISGAKVDLAARTASIGRVALQQPRVVLDRARDGSLNVTRWLVPPAGDAAASSPASAASSPGPSPWSVTLADVSIDDGRLRWRDEAASPDRETPVELSVSALAVSAKGLAWPKAAAPADLRVSAVVADPAAPRGSRRQQGGSVDWRGRVALDPLAITGALRVERFPLHALEPYAGRGFNATVQRAEGHWRGDVALRQRPNGIEATAAGEALLAELHVFGLDPASARRVARRAAELAILATARARGGGGAERKAARGHRRGGRERLLLAARRLRGRPLQPARRARGAVGRHPARRLCGRAPDRADPALARRGPGLGSGPHRPLRALPHRMRYRCVPACRWSCAWAACSS